MDEPLYPHAGVEAASKPLDVFKAFNASVFADGAPGKTRQLIAVAVAHVTQCP